MKGETTMSYKLHTDESGEVEIVKPAGSSFVRVKVPEGQAIGIIESADKIDRSDMFDGFEICVDDGEYYFAGDFKADEGKSEPKEEEKAADKPKNDQNFKDKWKK